MTRDEVLAWLETRGTRRNVLGMARYGIVAKRAFGVSVGTLQSLAKRLGKDHAMLPLIERSARDQRNVVKKAVSWALRAL